jgi:hypothetical protein
MHNDFEVKEFSAKMTGMRSGLLVLILGVIYIWTEIETAENDTDTFVWHINKKEVSL